MKHHPRASLELGLYVTDVEIRYTPPRPLSDPTTEKSIAHELTHALMVYSEHYHIPCAPKEVPEVSVQTAAEIVDLIDDVIVDVRIEQLGFDIFTPERLERYRRIADVLETAQDRSQITSEIGDPVLAEISSVKDYIYAWAMPRFLEIPEQPRRLFGRFSRRFPQILKSEFSKAAVIKKSIRANDIFTVEGRTNTVIDAMSLFPIDERTYLAAIASA